jgi:zinc protease
MKVINRIFLLIVVAFGARSSASPHKKLNIQEATLSNGLRVIVIKTKAKNMLFGCIGYFVGSGDDQRNVVGISHFLEHMMFKGTKNLSGPKLKDWFFTYNKDSGAATSYDVTFFYYTCHKSFLDFNLKIEADRMRNLLLSKKDIENEKGVIMEERKMRVESNPITKYMEEAAWKATYLYSSYSYPLVGYADQIEACNQEEIQKHYNRYYVPNNAFILLIGDITLEEAVKKVQKYFGKIPQGKDPKRNRVIDPPTGLKFVIDRESKQISVHNLNVIYKVDRELISNIRKLLTVELVLGILAEGESSVLSQNIVDKKKLSYTLRSYLDVRAFDKARINIATVVRESKNVENVYQEIAAIVENCIDKYLTKERVEKEKRKAIDQIDMMEDNQHDMGMFVLINLINGYSLNELNKVRDIINSIKFEDVVEVAKKIFTKENRIIKIYSHPKEREI